MGKLFAQAEAKVTLSADIIDYYAIHAKKFLADKKLSPEHGKAFIRHSPIGVLFGVEPWNFPYIPGSPFCSAQHYDREYHSG